MQYKYILIEGVHGVDSQGTGMSKQIECVCVGLRERFKCEERIQTPFFCLLLLDKSYPICVYWEPNPHSFSPSFFLQNSFSELPNIIQN